MVIDLSSCLVWIGLYIYKIGFKLVINKVSRDIIEFNYKRGSVDIIDFERGKEGGEGYLLINHEFC